MSKKVKVEAPKMSGKILWIVSGVLLALIIVLLCLNNPTVRERVDQIKNYDKERTISDSELITNLAAKVNLVLSAGENATDGRYTRTRQPVSLERINNLSDEEKMMIAVRSDKVAKVEPFDEGVRGALSESDFARIRDLAGADLSDEQMAKDVTKLSLSIDMRNMYTRTFGKLESIPESFPEGYASSCVEWHYFESIDAFLKMRDCEKATTEAEDIRLIYLYDFKEKLSAGEAYVYFAAGRAKKVDAGFEISHALEGDDEHKELISETDSVKGYRINDSNYGDFAHYRALLLRYSSSEYYFDSIEKID
ncbi:hypothetical protein IJ847_01715 [Candidatus Saccharibacteria bacterium]|nr:hypothetical protein [Candidatus Saccharibacteria bacterium]